MTFVKFGSIEGREALARALESHAVQRIASGKLDVSHVEDMVDADVRAAFQIIRWPDSAEHDRFYGKPGK